MPAPTPQQIYDLALQHHRAGRLQQAESLYHQILSNHPNHPDALQMLGGITFLTGRHPEALELIRRAIAINPSAPDYHGNLAIVLASTGQPDAAIQSLRHALALRPDYPEALYNLAKLLSQQNKIDEAIATYQHTLRLQPVFPEAHNNLAELLRRAVRPSDALSSLQTALSQRQDFPEALFNLSLTLVDLDRLEEALAALAELLRLHPNSPEAHNELGNVLRELNRPHEALSAHQRAVALRPDFHAARWQMALCHLTLGEFEQGWAFYESRRQLPEWIEPHFSQPQWTGSPLAGKRLLLWTEQGFGDTLQFIRYALLLTAQGANVILRCQRALARLLPHQLTLEQVIPEGDPLPPFDLHCPLLSLPHLFHTTLNTIPTKNIYIEPDPALSEIWRQRLISLSPNLLVSQSPPHPLPLSPPPLKVGVAWATNLLPKSALKRWIDPSALTQLAAIPNIQFYSLQKSPTNALPLPPPPGLNLIDLTDQLHDFADTAALIANLDLVITCDTAVAHLGGAMGKPTWIALPFAAPWRWMQDRTDSPWYPAVRIFRQPSPNNWCTPLRQIAAELARWNERNVSNP